MILKINYKYCIAFLSLLFVMAELHEIVHTTVGRIICGCWGKRDFNSWGVCDSCENNPLVWMSTLAGPIFTFIMIWVGFIYLKKNKTLKQQSFGFSLIFANLPFGRLFNPMLKSGDEKVLINNFISDINIASFVTFIVIFIITFYPLQRAYKLIKNKRKLGIFLLFYLVPFVIIIVTILIILNTFLSLGILNQQGLLGSPLLVNVWSVLVLGVYLIMRKHIYELGKSVN